MKFKNLIITAFSLSLILSSAGNVFANSTESINSVIKLQIGSKKVYVNNVEKNSLQVAPFIKNQSALVPIRFVSENLNAQLEWNPQKQEITINKDSKKMILTINKNESIVNGKIVKMDSSATLINGTTFVPIRFISENLNASVTWDQKTSTIEIKSMNSEPFEDNTPTTPVTEVNNEKDRDEIIAVLTKNTVAMTNDDVETFMSTYNTLAESKEKLVHVFASDPSIFSVENVELTSNDGINAIVKFTRIQERTGIYNGQLGTIKLRMTADVKLIKVNEQWKINSFTNSVVKPF